MQRNCSLKQDDDDDYVVDDIHQFTCLSEGEGEESLACLIDISELRSDYRFPFSPLTR